MSSQRWCRSVGWCPLALVLSLVVAACGHGSAADQVQAGAAPVSSTAAPAPTSTTVARATDPSTAEGLTAADFREAVMAPVPAAKGRAGAPVAEPVRLASGATVWRIRIPGRFAVRSARVVVSVGGRRVGEGVPGSHLRSLVAVTRNPSGLTAGAAVTYQWPGADPVAAGRLVVVR